MNIITEDIPRLWPIIVTIFSCIVCIIVPYVKTRIIKHRIEVKKIFTVGVITITYLDKSNEEKHWLWNSSILYSNDSVAYINIM